MPDFAGHGTRTRSSVAGETLNPYATDRVPGGSSGGTATAVNASFAVLGLGTETGGSIQNPAAAQALVGMKPTFGLVPLEGVVPIDATYRDVVGPLARTVLDAALTLDVIAGPTAEDLSTYAASEHIPAEGYAAALDATALEGGRFGLVGSGWRDSFLPLAPETEALYADAVTALRAEGAEVVEDPFAGRGWVELYGQRPSVPSAGAHDMLVYLRGWDRTRLFTAWRSGRSCRDGSFDGGAAAGRRPPRPPRSRGTRFRRGAWKCGRSSARCWRITNSTVSSSPRPASPSARSWRTRSDPTSGQQPRRTAEQHHQRHRPADGDGAVFLLRGRHSVRPRLHRRSVDRRRSACVGPRSGAGHAGPDCAIADRGSALAATRFGRPGRNRLSPKTAIVSENGNLDLQNVNYGCQFLDAPARFLGRCHAPRRVGGSVNRPLVCW